MSVVANAADRARNVIRSRGGTIRTREAVESGIHPRTLYQLRDSGELLQLSRGLFRLAECAELSDPDIVVVAKRIPRGILCLVSALSFHELTTQIPSAISIAIPIAAKAPRLDSPMIRVHKFSEATYDLGIETHRIDGVDVKVYDPEKTIIDCFRFRNSLGMDIVLEALKRYRSRKKMKVNLLMKYAAVSRIKTVVTPYLEASL